MCKNIILMTWEYPPASISPVAHYSKSLAESISEKNNVVVLTYDNSRPNRFVIENNNLFMITFGDTINCAYNPLVWSLTMSTEMEKKGTGILKECDIDMIHAQDWITLPAAITLARQFGLPLFLTLHSIEPVRVGGNSDPYIESIKRIEYEGCRLAERIFVSNLWMKYQVMCHYSVPEDKIVVACGDDWESEVIRHYGGGEVIGQAIESP